MNRGHSILLVEDNPDAVELTLRAFRKSKVLNEIVTVSDGIEALDYLFATGTHAGRLPHLNPEVVLLDLKLPKIGGLEVLRAMRGDGRTRRIPASCCRPATRRKMCYQVMIQWILRSSWKQHSNWECTGW